MAYQARNLSVLAYANGFTLWTYDAQGDAVLNDNYFNGAFDLLREGDVVYCVRATQEKYDQVLDMHMKTMIPRTIQITVVGCERSSMTVKVEKL